MNTQWKILGIDADGELITQARYFATATENDFVVETEGNWYFPEPKLTTAFADVTEELILSWIDKTSIETRLAEQLASLKKQKVTVAPWLPQTFTLDLKG
jgi:hypothetical protein